MTTPLNSFAVRFVFIVQEIVTSEHVISFLSLDLDNVVNINAPQMPLSPGQSHTLSCVVYSDITPQVKWMGTDGSVLVGDDDINIGDLVVMENGTVVLPLSFSSLRTSQAGTYTCQSVVSNPFSLETDTEIVSVQGTYECATLLIEYVQYVIV